MERQRGENELLLTCREAGAGVEILRCATGDREVRLPERVAGRPVTALGPYVLAGREPRLPGEGLFQVWVTCGAPRPPEHRPEELRALAVPPGVESLGDYGLYGCRNLERLALPGTLTALGSGALMNCAALRVVELEEHSGGGCLGRLLSECPGDLEAALDTPAGRGRLFFPAYQEELELLVAPHIFQNRILGGGYACRQCVTGGQVAYTQYDGCAGRLLAEQNYAAAGYMALCRLSAPLNLSAAARRTWEGVLRDHGGDVARRLVERGQTGDLAFLLEGNLLSREAVEGACDAARALGRTAVLALLLDHCRPAAGRGMDKTYEL